MNDDTNGTYEHAIIFAIQHHGDQTRWNGEPYITHPLRVSARVEKIVRPSYEWAFGPISLDKLKKAAILHDVIEDTAQVCKRLVYGEIIRFFGQDVAQLVWTVSRQKSLTYAQYIDEVIRVARSADQVGALVIKKADLEDNLSDLDPNHGLQKRYQPALKKVTKALEKVLDD